LQRYYSSFYAQPHRRSLARYSCLALPVEPEPGKRLSVAPTGNFSADIDFGLSDTALSDIVQLHLLPGANKIKELRQSSWTTSVRAIKVELRTNEADRNKRSLFRIRDGKIPEEWVRRAAKIQRRRHGACQCHFKPVHGRASADERAAEGSVPLQMLMT
jgi:hypothetical protein